MSGEIIIALITGGVFTAIIKGLFDLAKSHMARKNAFSNTINDLNTIYAEMDELKSKAACDRVLVIATKNGGGVPVPGAQLFASILFETYDKSLGSVKSSWQNRSIDESYVKTLLRLESEGIIVVKTEELGEGILKDVYVTAGITKSVMAKIKSTDKRYYYLSCNFKEDVSDEVAIKVHVLDAVEKIRGIL